MASISTEYQDRLRVLFLASEWGSSKGGLSTINRELAINIAKSPGVDVTLFVVRCSDDDKNAALRHKINLVKATRHPGMDELQWLSFLPDDLHSDVVVGHGSKFGPQAYTIRKSQKCKWVQVVHTVPEELGMHKTYANPIAGAERKHKREVELCESADFVVPIGPKLYEAFRCYLSSCKKGEMIFNFTPGIFSEFLEVEQVAEREGKFQVLLFGRGDKEDFFVKGFDIAAKAVASLENIKLVFVGATEGELEDVKDSFLECGIEASNLTVRSFLQDRESLKSLFCEVDLAVMPSRTEGFGLAALEALSAGLPILVSKNSGFGEALSKVQFGPYFVVNSDDPQVWANAIKRLQDRDRCDRLEESELLRSLYAKRYSWEKQCKEFILKMASAVEGLFKQSQSVTFQGASQQTGISSGCHSGILTMSIEMESATFQENHSGDDTLLMKEMAMQFFDTMAAGIPNEDKPKCLYYYLEGARQVKVKQAVEGSLRITVECPTLEILEQLWEDYCSGHLNAVAEECLLTEDIKRRFHVVSVSLKTRILEEDYLACKEVLKDYSESHQEPQVKERVNLLQDHTQAAGVTHEESVADFDPVMFHFSVNGKGQLLTHNSWPSEEVNKLLVVVECKNTEVLDQLWRDYRSGHLNVVAEKFLLTDDIKRRFHLKSVKFKTTILEEDYLTCKAFLLNNSTHGEERNSHNNLDLHDVRGGLESTEPTSMSAKTSEVKGKVMDRNREEEDESKKLNQQPRTENKSKKKKRYKPPKESEESAQTISSSDHKTKEGASSSKGEAHAAVNYLEEPDKIMSFEGGFTETSPLVEALPLNTEMLRSSSQANVDSDTANLAQQNFPKPRNKACQSNEGTQNADGMTKDKRENPKKVVRCSYEVPEAKVSLEDADAKRYSDILRERLRELNFKENGFILIANKLPAKYRGTAHLSFLQNIPWVTVFDLFDPSSKQDGLHHACNETSDAPRAKIRTLDEFKEITPDKDSLISTRSTTWIFNSEEMQKGDWIKCSKDCLYRALSAYKQCFPPGNLICVFLCLSENAVNETADIMESSFSILGNSSRNCVTILSESRTVVEPFIKASKPSLQKELGECSVTGIPWSLLKEIVRELVGPSKFEEKGATTELPYFTGFREVLNKTINSWDDLELYCPNPRLPRLAEEIEKERGAFYKGAQVSQVNLFHGHSIPRSLEKDVSAKVGNALKSLTKENLYENYQVKTITVSYEPGSGATTLCRRILWSKKSEYRCAVVKAITSSTDYQIEKLQCIGYDKGNINFSRPVLVLVDNFPESDMRLLTEHIKRRQTRCVLLTTLPISTAASNFEITLRKLDEEETTRVKNILINITGIDSERRREAEQVLEREKRFIWFGLELFGREYLKIKERLQNHIGNILGAFLGERLQEHQVLLEMCCFLNKYSDGNIILPHSVVMDFLYVRLSGNETQCPAIQDIHEAFGGLLLEVQDEKHGYYGWRPAHSLVSEVVTSRINIEETAILALEKVVQGKAYVMKFLKQQVFRLLLDRKRICDPVLLKEQPADDGTVGTDLESEVFGYYGRRTRYSPVIAEILERESSVREAGALKVLLAICEQATQTEDKAYAWQQLARFMGYEMRTKIMDKDDDLHQRLYKAMKKESTTKHPMPLNGIDAAHKAVDIAVSLQPSYTNHYNSKGVLYLLQLKDYKPPSVRSLSEAVEICRKALEIYDKALATSKGANHFPMIGKIQAIILLLEIVKDLPCFDSDDMEFTRYLKEGHAPSEVVEMLSFEQQSFVQSLSSTILNVLNELFGNVKLKQTTTYDENEIRSLNNAKIRGSNLRRKFYEITGLNKTELCSEEYSIRLLSSASHDLALYQQQVQDILYIKDETPYSSWSKLDNNDVHLIYQLLQSLCLLGHGSHNDMLICSKACLHLKEKPPVDDLDKIIKIFVEKFPNSEWANLFYYMIHFPIPSGGLAQYTPQTKEAIKKCVTIVQQKAGSGFRKSGAEYFLGKGIGLNAIVNSHEFQWVETKWKTKTQFWRGKEPSEKLERVKGQKEAGRKGIISYHGIQINFDNTLYPNESRDDLWFYLGFTVAGPYAYDPVDNDTYDSIKRQSASLVPATFSAFSEHSTHSSQLSNNTSKCGARRKVRLHQPQAKDFLLEENSNENDPSDPEIFHDIPEASDDNNGLITVGGRFNALIERRSVQNTHNESESRWNGNKQASSKDQWQTVQRKTSKGRESQAKVDEVKDKSVLGRRGSTKKYFDLKCETRDGKLHHGAFVLGSRKAQECRKHKLGSGHEETDRCNYAHGWRGDTLQFVCTKCTDEGKFLCNEKVKHEPYIWNLGPYLNSRGEVWKC